jgi:hypothetical protein
MKRSKDRSAAAASPAAIEKFNFHGDMLDVVTDDGQHYVVLARLCEPLGLSVQAQTRKLLELAWAGVAKIATPSPGGPQETVCLSIRSVAGWLFTINAGKVAPHLRDKLALYQRECADVLADHFLGRRGEQGPMIHTLREAIEATIGPLLARIEALESRPVSGGRLALGAAAARTHVLDPLREVARIEARAVGKTDSKTLRRMRKLADDALRERLSFPRDGGQAWSMFPQARLAEVHCALIRLLHDARKRADIAAPTTTQLRLVKTA